ncbi:MAG: crossover junction endodeoxyribonuclease RuvC [Clostridia bacterium]|nr:crossover junction endodeoxyribonuclease RuvC [Clostridia bacterium]
MPNKVIMGIDPGFGIMGWGVIKLTGEEVSLIDYGAIETDKEQDFGQRLCQINDRLASLFEEYKPDDIAIEELFFAANVTTGLKVAAARGIALMRATYYHGQVFNYKPNQIKIAITGGCKAKKKEMQTAVGKILNQDQKIKPDDAADALAIALTHAFTLCGGLSR